MSSPPVHPANASSSPPPPTMSPHHPGLVSLFSSLFEPNFLILVSYLSINLYLGFRVFRFATKRYRQLKLCPPESAQYRTIIEHTHAHHDYVGLHDHMFRTPPPRRSAATDTPVADALIRLATWAFKSEALHAKRIVALLALISLASTWYYMFAFLRHSYLAYLERCHLTSYPLPPLPPPLDLSTPRLIVPALHLRLLRISQWLASLSLFKHAWMQVINHPTSWWWSSEICILTVGAWALFLRHEATRIRMPHVWTVMALGQLVAISFAFNLFNLAIVYRLDTLDLLAARSDRVVKPKHRVIEPLEEIHHLPNPESSPASWERLERLAQSRPYLTHSLSAVSHQHSTTPTSPSTSLSPTSHSSRHPNTRTIFTDVILQRKPLPPRPTFTDKIGHTMNTCIPEHIGLPLFVFAGLSSVLQHPDTFTKVMIMHLFPLLISLYPSQHQPSPFISARPTSPSRPSTSLERESPSFPEPTPQLTTVQAFLTIFGRSATHVPLWNDPKVLYLGLGAVSIALRSWLTYLCFTDVDTDAAILDRACQLLTLLFPTTFLRHPAQSSISSDHVCVALSATVFVLIESGVWLWKMAVASPSSFLPEAQQTESEQQHHDPEHRPNTFRATIRLDRADRNLIETQARTVIALVVLSPLIGGSAMLSLYLAMRCTWVHQHTQYRKLQDQAVLTAPSRLGTDVVEDKEEARVIENEEGERYLELRKIKIKLLSPTSSSPSRPANQPRSAAEQPDTSPPESPTSSVDFSGAQSDEAQASQKPAGRAGRRARTGTSGSEAGASSSFEERPHRATSIRSRQPPQRYRQASHTPTPSTPHRRS